MKIAFTICSNNYLGQAISWLESIENSNPDYTSFIVLVDKIINAEKYIKSSLKNKIIEVDNINIDNINYMVNNYNIIELNTAIKPYCFQYFFSKYNPISVLYFDPDIIVFNNLSYIDNKLFEYDCILTPHFLVPNIRNVLAENKILNYGLYNLGFIGIKNNDNGNGIINWWASKLATMCIMDTANGFYVDQLWINLVPIYFSNVYISKNSALNVAYWNLNERKLSFENNSWLVDNNPLIFFHFSSFKINQSDFLAKSFKFDLFNNSNDLKKLAQSYNEILLGNKFVDFSEIKCVYGLKKNSYFKTFIAKKLLMLAYILKKKYRVYEYL